MRKLTTEELTMTKGGVAITLTTVMAVMAIALMAVIIYRIFMSDKGSTTIPGGFKFSWN